MIVGSINKHRLALALRVLLRETDPWRDGRDTDKELKAREFAVAILHENGFLSSIEHDRSDDAKLIRNHIITGDLS